MGIVGGTGAITGLTGWLGKVQADRILEVEKARHAVELERVRATLAQAGDQQERISQAEFELYTAVWTQLQDVTSAADALWERANLDNLEAFRLALRAARAAIERGRLILEEHHYFRLQGLIRVFGDYEVGKGRLISITSRAELDQEVGGEWSGAEQIRQNEHNRDDYRNLLNEILPRFKRKLGLA
jgi:hypothetical protein